MSLIRAASLDVLEDELAVFRLPALAPLPHSEEYEEKKRALLARGIPGAKTLSHRAKIGLLIAAAILAALLSACAVFHEEIGKLFSDPTPAYVELLSPTGKSTIGTHYAPRYLPTGYVKESATYSTVLTEIVFAGPDGVITFRQVPLKRQITALVIDGPNDGVMTLDGRRVYFARRDDGCTYVFEDGNYGYTLIVPPSVSERDARMMLRSLTAV